MVYSLSKYTVGAFYKLWLGKIDGLDNIPKDNPFIIALNHASYYDTVLPYSVLIPKLNRQMHALVNGRYWNILGAETILNWGRCIPVYVGKDANQRKNEAALKKAAKFLNQNHIIQIFPEGTRSPDGKLKKGHSGAAKLAVMAKVPVIPMGIIGSNKVWPREKIFPRFKRCQVKIGKPIYFDKYYNKTLSKNDFEKITRAIMKEIAKLIGQKYNY